MHLDLDATGRTVVLFGTAAGSRHAINRYRGAGSRVTAVITGPDAGDVSVRSVRVVAAPAPDDRSALLRLVGPAWLVVIIDPLETSAQQIRTLCAQLKIMVVSEAASEPGGSVTLVGGGPGRTGLLTLDAVEALGHADVVFYDRLAPTDELRRLAPAAELVDVGKTPYHHKITQTQIERRLVDRAVAGQAVVRLKGGDPFVFGRGGEEVLACVRAGVTVRVIPGVSSAIAVPGAAGIPITHRQVSHCCTVISGHVPFGDAELTALAGLGGTVVIMMGMANLTQIVGGLIRAGLPADTPAAVVQDGFGDDERRVTATLATLPAVVRQHRLGSPAVVIIGAVVALAESIAAAVGADATSHPLAVGSA